MLKKNLLSLWLIVIVFSLVSLTAYISVSAFSISWTNNPNNCKPTNSTDLYNGQSCYPNGQVFCGLMGANVQCADLANVTTAPVTNATSSTIYSGSNGAGYIVNCLATADAGSPYCNNNGAYWCNADAICLNTNHRITQCNANLWSYEGSAYTCTNSCTSGYFDCNGGVDCDTQNGSACSFLPGIDGTYICSVDAGGSCRSEISGGGSAYTCTCTPEKSFFETGTNTSYSTTDPLLWGTQYSTGDLINMGNSSIAEVFNVDNSGLLTTTNATVNTMRIAFNDGVGTVGIYSINTNPDGALAGNKGSLAMDYVNGKVYVNINGGTNWNQLLDDSTALGPTYTISTGLTDTSGTLTADISTGIIGGQTIYGGNNAGDNLTIESTTNVTKGNILLNPDGGKVGIGTTNPSETLEVSGNLKISKNLTTEGWVGTSIIDSPPYTTDHTAVWTGNEMIVWGGIYRTNPSAPDVISNLGGLYNPTDDIWNSTTLTNAPGARYQHTAVWTGSKMIIWGGFNGASALNTGAMYDTTNDSWQTISTSGAPTGRSGHTAVWTGSKMVIWGGQQADGSLIKNGGIYDPVTDTWESMATGTLTGRIGHSMIWSGKDVIIWGGESLSGNENTGEKFNMETGVWTAISTTNAPTGRKLHEAVWTGNKMFVLGGMGSDGSGNASGGLYDPISDTWEAISSGGNLYQNYGFSIVWTGEKAIIWGGRAAVTLWGEGLNTGAIYDPVKNTWTAMTVTGATPEARINHVGVWTGSKMIVWGGYDADSMLTIYRKSGGVYTPTDFQGNLIVDGNAFINGQLSTVGDITAGGYYSLGGADLAENYIASDPSITAGDVVKLSAGLKLSKTFETYDSGAVGVVSSKPGMTLSDISQIAEEDKNNLRPLALSGRVPVKVTTENGNIEVGDYLVPASKPGYAMKQCGIKSCNSGIVIGRALEEFKTTDNGDTKIVIEKLESNVAEVESTIDAIESSETLDNETKSDVSDIAEVAESLSRTNITNSNGEGRILMFVDLGYRLSPDQEGYLKQLSLNPLILSGGLTMNQINSESLTVVDMNVTGLIKTNKISTSLITADSDKKQIEVKLSDNIGLSKFIITNSEGGYLFGVNSRGILEFGEANPSRGQTTIPAGSTELKVNAEGVNKDSIILLTLISNMNENQTLKLSSQGDGYFIVRLNSASEEDLKFNWWYSN